MVMVASALLPLEGGSAHLDTWLHGIEASFKAPEVALVRQAAIFVQSNSGDAKTPLQQDCFTLSLQIANLLLNLQLDADALAAGILYPLLQYTELDISDLTDEFPPRVIKMLQGVMHMDDIGAIQRKSNTGAQIDNFRRMLLAMVDDVRTVVIKLAERVVYLRHLDQIATTEQVAVAEQAMSIYAPLANRLGILELKWEIEDLAFHILQPAKYKTIAKSLKERRMDREQFVLDFKQQLTDALANAHLPAEISGRAKHIYSIHNKMRRKDVGYEDVYDVTAFRILVKDITDCYTALSIVHTQWPHIEAEFDDYIATPQT